MSGIKYLLDTNYILGLLQCITLDEDNLIRTQLKSFTVIPLLTEIEDSVITLRQTRKIKLPDAIIAATALVTKNRVADFRSAPKISCHATNVSLSILN